ncbi:Piso0_000122 [Millerozyma farinosa CBS 7064]|uniref:Cysteine protease RIM13 n=1 Tax=Pichia sorbitophila (strain ATCC MYA-4447 / BCRC 22081 / CBS 7064 / NBRC 10061 / NRRL Y-12695) TaxID=559304 RepID=G8YUK7_PICSO|nr:Piso0_000122 [Millerozyma farinosa CBS 7064]
MRPKILWYLLHPCNESMSDSEELRRIIPTLEECYLRFSLNDRETAKRKCLSLIKSLNKLAQSDVKIKRELIEISRFTLEFYKRVDQNIPLSYYDRLLWTGSRCNGNFYPPVINITSDRDTVDMGVLSPAYTDAPVEETMTLPQDLEARFEKTGLDHWRYDEVEMMNLYQDLLTNCSFVSSLLAIVLSGDGERLLSLISPHEASDIYRVKFNLNGCRRVVEIGSSLPVLRDSKRKLTVSSSYNPQLRWPALIEKAYLKLSGEGYEFNGSNMAHDIFLLSTWIPEIRTISDDYFIFDTKLIKNFEEKKVTIGIGTGNISESLHHKVIPGHDYVLVSVDSKRKSFRLKNPWYSNTEEDQRIIEIMGNEIHLFKYLYINWKPSAFFMYKSNCHFIINKGCHEGNPALYENPQYSLRNTSDTRQEVWILLERHSSASSDRQQVDINMKLYCTPEGERIISSDRYEAVFEGTNTNSKTSLLKLDLEPRQNYTLVTFCSINCTCTCYFYNNISEDFMPTKAMFKNKELLSIVDDEWNFRNSGGNWSFSSYINNPQYDLEVDEASHLSIAMFTDLKHHYVGFDLFAASNDSKGHPIREFNKNKVAVSQTYNKQYQYEEVLLEPGLYKLVLSTYENNVHGKYKLYIRYNSTPRTVSINPIHASLGLFLKKKKLPWMHNTKTSLLFNTKDFNSVFKIRLLHYNSDPDVCETISSYRPLLRGRILLADSQESIYTTNNWSDSLYGVFIECLISKPGTYCLLVERLDPGYGGCVIEIGSNKSFHIS